MAISATVKRPLAVVAALLLITALIVLRVNPVIPCSSSTILQKAAQCECYELVALQLYLGVDPDGPDRTPLIEAIGRGNTRMALLLISRGADLERNFASGEPSGPPLLWAILYGRKDIAMALLARGVSVDDPERGLLLHEAVRNCPDGEVISTLITRGVDVNAGYQATGETALHVAAEMGLADTVELLLSKGADANKRTTGGRIPLDYALAKGNERVAEVLRKHGRASGGGR